MTSATEIRVESLLAVQTQLKNRLKGLEQSWRGGMPPWRMQDGRWEEHKETIEAIKSEIDRLDNEIISVEMTERDPEQDAEIRAELYATMAMNGVHDDVSLYMHTPHQERLFQEGIMRQLQYEDDSWGGHDYTGGHCPLCHSFDEDWVSVQGDQVCYQNCAGELYGFAQLLIMFMGPSYRFFGKDQYSDFYFADGWEHVCIRCGDRVKPYGYYYEGRTRKRGYENVDGYMQGDDDHYHEIG